MPEHPEIRWIEETGYPSWMQEGKLAAPKESAKTLSVGKADRGCKKTSL